MMPTESGAADYAPLIRPTGWVAVTRDVEYPVARHDLDTVDLTALSHNLPDEGDIAQSCAKSAGAAGRA